MEFRQEPLLREEMIRNYLLKRLGAETAESFEGHYLGCEECFEELRTTQLLMSGLSDSALASRRMNDSASRRSRAKSSQPSVETRFRIARLALGAIARSGMTPWRRRSSGT